MTFFPPESEEQSSVLLVYDPTSPSASPSPLEKSKSLEDVEKELLKMARDAADVKTEVVAVEKKWHDAVVGRGGTTLAGAVEQLGAQGLVKLFGCNRIVLEVLAGVFLALADSFAAVAVPGAGFLDQVVQHAEFDQLAFE